MWKLSGYVTRFPATNGQLWRRPAHGAAGPRHCAGRDHRGHQDQPPSPGRAGAEEFRLLPGGILSKGIVRGYAGAVGLDQNDWTERFLKASHAAGQVTEDDSGWTAFAFNVGKARVMRHDALRFACAGRRDAAVDRRLCRLLPLLALLRHARRMVAHAAATMRPMPLVASSWLAASISACHFPFGASRSSVPHRLERPRGKPETA